MPQPPVFADPSLPDPASVVLTFLESVGRRSDAEFYLKLFRQLPKPSFAILVMDAPVIRYALPSVADQLRFLHDLGLFAPVVLGLFEPPRAARGSARLAARCEAQRPIVHGATEMDLASTLRSELEGETLPIVSLAAMERETAERRFEWLRDLAIALETRKIVVVRRRGGLGPRGRTRLSLGPGHELTSHDSGISVINLTTDYEKLMASDYLESTEDQELLKHLGTVLAGTHRQTVASVTSPFNVLRELFTEKGAGTLIKRGTQIQRHASYATLDRPRLRQLLESSFRRKLLPAFFERVPHSVYVEENYRGAAIVEASPVAPFLTKFAVDRVAQGEGMGRDLWQALLRDHGSLFWRARQDNPIAGWYTTLCDGMMRTSSWNVYWRGVDAAVVPALIENAVSRPQDFRD